MCWEQHYPKLQNGLKDFIALEIFVSKSCTNTLCHERARTYKGVAYMALVFLASCTKLIVLYTEDTETIIMNSVKSVNIKI